LLCKYPVDLLAFDKGSEEQHKEQRLNLCREFLEHALIPCNLQKPKKWGNDFRFQNKMTIFAYCLAVAEVADDNSCWHKWRAKAEKTVIQERFWRA
jgi:hypothetical protein